MPYSIPLELHHSIGMLIFMCECVKVNIVCAFKGVIAFVRVSLLGVAYPLRENILGVGYTLMDGSHSGPRG